MADGDPGLFTTLEGGALDVVDMTTSFVHGAADKVGLGSVVTPTHYSADLAAQSVGLPQEQVQAASQDTSDFEDTIQNQPLANAGGAVVQTVKEIPGAIASGLSTLTTVLIVLAVAGGLVAIAYTFHEARLLKGPS